MWDCFSKINFHIFGMTRINLVSPTELSDQWLLAEYRELPRVIKQNINIFDAPEKYCLGVGHVKWAKKHALFCLNRYVGLCEEMIFRGFRVNYPAKELFAYNTVSLDYLPSDYDINLSKNRLLERYYKNPNIYRWSSRDVPQWIKKHLET